MSQNEEKSREELRAQLEKTLRLADAATDKLTRDRVGTENVSELMTSWNRLSWRNDRAALFRSGRPSLAIQVELAA